MIKDEELNKILEKFKNLEDQLNSSIEDKDAYISISKEYADLKPLAQSINNFLDLRHELEDLNNILNGDDKDLIAIAKSEIAELKNKIATSEQALKQLLIPKDPLEAISTLEDVSPAAPIS